MRRAVALAMALVVAGCESTSYMTMDGYHRMRAEYAKHNREKALVFTQYRDSEDEPFDHWFIAGGKASYFHAEAEAMRSCKNFLAANKHTPTLDCTVAYSNDRVLHDPYQYTEEYAAAQDADDEDDSSFEDWLGPLVAGAMVLGAVAAASSGQRTSPRSFSTGGTPRTPATNSAAAFAQQRSQIEAQERQWERQQRAQEEADRRAEQARLRTEEAERERKASAIRTNRLLANRCVYFSSALAKWVNGCSRSVLIDYRTLNNCSFGAAGSKGTAGPVAGMSEGAYNPTLKNCVLEWSPCFYDDWVNGLCRSDLGT